MEKKNCVCDRSFSVGHSTGFLTPQRKQHVFKTPETKHPGTRQLNHANRKKKMNILQIGLGFLFICFFFSLYRLPGLLEFSGCRSGVSCTYGKGDHVTIIFRAIYFG